MTGAGSVFSIWNGQETAPCSLMVQCGGTHGSVDFDISPRNGLSARQPLTAILKACVESWDPDRARVFSPEAYDALVQDKSYWEVDWMLWVPASVTDIPPPAEMTPFGRGTLIVTQPDPPNISDPETIARLRMIREKVQALVPGYFWNK